MSTQSHESRWPGERENPTRHDVEIANELPEPSLLSDFKTALLASQEAAQCQTLMRTDLSAAVIRSGQGKFTYPMAILSDFPSIPANAEIFRLREIFTKSCCSHVFVGRLPMLQPSREVVVPPLRFATACLGSVYARHPSSEARDLFWAGGKLWAVMMEVDNREARSLDMLKASTLLVSYGALSSDEKIRDMTGIILCSSITITRRLRLNDSAQLEHVLGPRASSNNGAFVWMLWLVDTFYGLHSDLAVSSISSREVWTKMPSSCYEFQDIYNSLLNENGPRSLSLPEALSQDDAILLLTAILSDLICIRRSLGRLAHQSDPARKSSRNHHNPFVPLSPHTEIYRMQNLLSSALDRWHETFNAFSPPDVMAFYHYCRLYLLYPQLLALPRIVGYIGAGSETNPERLTLGSISDDSMQHAWRILDDVAAWPRLTNSTSLCPLWLPVIVFHASLTVWAKQNFISPRAAKTYGSARILLPFKVELEKMPWPCCKEMTETLERLMAAP